MKTSQASLLMLASVGLSSADAGNIEERAGTGIGLLVGAIAGAIQGSGFLDGNNLICDEKFPGGSNYQYYLTEQLQGGQYGLACWATGGDTVVWDQPTADAVGCLAELHSEQASTCISLGGTGCADGYNGPLGNVRVPVFGDSSDPRVQMSPDDVAVIQSLTYRFLDQNVSRGDALGPYLYSCSDEGQTLTNVAAQLQVNWYGGVPC